MLQHQHILIVSQAKADGLRLSSLEARGFSVATMSNPERVLDELVSSSCDLLVVDLTTTVDGIELVKRVRNIATPTKVPILVIGEWGSGLPSLAMSLGADACAPAPLESAWLITMVERLLYRRAAGARAGE